MFFRYTMSICVCFKMICVRVSNAFSKKAPSNSCDIGSFIVCHLNDIVERAYCATLLGLKDLDPFSD